jgi:hydroxyacylglutathione hydrolase
MTDPLRIETVVSLPFEENTYVAWLPDRREAVVIDPGLEPDAILRVLREHRLAVAAILNTHGHADHIAGNGAIKEVFPSAPLLIGAADEVMLRDANANLSALFGMPITSPPADDTVREGDTIEVAGIPFEVFDVPGHSPGHVVFLYRSNPAVLFGGDVLFRGGIGRTDWPGGDTDLLLDGIRTKVLTLPSDTAVYPGHGPATTVGVEGRTNPFVGMGGSGLH